MPSRKNTILIFSKWNNLICQFHHSNPLQTDKRAKLWHQTASTISILFAPNWTQQPTKYGILNLLSIPRKNGLPFQQNKIDLIPPPSRLTWALNKICMNADWCMYVWEKEILNGIFWQVIKKNMTPQTITHSFLPRIMPGTGVSKVKMKYDASLN